MNFTVGSLFSGIGGLELGLERAIPGSKTVWQVEQDPYARAVLAKHWPEARRYEDVRQVGAHNLEPVDICIGGFPCQDISKAGKREGITGSRSGLWTEYARIIRELRPRFVVVENVAALLNGGLDRVLGDLASLGYDAVWDCIPAAAVGAHHRRDRIFVVAYAEGLRCIGGSEANFVERKQEQLEARRQEGQNLRGELIRCCEDVADGVSVSAKEASWLFRRSLESARPWEPEPQLGRVADGVPARVDRLRCLGNAVVPQVAEVIGRVVADLDGRSGNK